MDTIIKQNAIGANIQQAANNIYNQCTIQDGMGSTGLVKLIETLKGRIESEPGAGKFIEDLADYMKPRPAREIVGLKKKLEMGKRAAQIDDAEYLKLKFSKKLVADELSESVQTVYVHILAYICSVYQLVVYPMILSGENNQAIDNKIHEAVISPIYKDIASANIGITADHVRGMLYFLTGNCHIKWH